MKVIRLYLPLLVILLLATLRVYSNCFKSVQNECLEPRESYFSDTKRFPGKQLSDFRKASINTVRKNFPSPHSELLIGMVIGADELGSSPRFKEALKTTGTIHVVVVSGFNVSLVANLVMGVLGSKYKTRNVIISQLFTFVYSVMTGFEPPVIRAWIMGGVVSWVKYYGRSVDGFRILAFTALVMVLIWPYFLFSVSFQLSFLATLGLVVFGNIVVDFFKRKFPKGNFFIEDLGTTISAQIFVLPIVSYYFGRISIISFLVNPLILWTVPIATVMGTFYIFIAMLSQPLAQILSILIYPFLNIFVYTVNFFSKIKVASVGVDLGLAYVIAYYLIVALILIIITKRKMKIYEKN